MIEHRLPSEYESLRSTVEQWARDVAAPVVGDYYERHEFPIPLIKGMADLGLFGLPIPEEYGGQGADYLALCLAIEELARVDSSLAITLEAATSLGALPILRFGTAEQKQEWLPSLAAGTALGAFGLTEPGGGSDASTMRTTAVRDGDEFIINGSKAFITNSGTALTRFITVAAVTGRKDDGRPEITTILVPSGSPGLTIGPPYSKVGWLSSDTHEVVLENVRVPAANVIGALGRGYAQFLQILDEGRIAISALATGLAQGCLDESLKYAQDRVAFGHPIATYQAIQFQLADMEARTHTARVTWRDAASRMLAGESFKRQAAIAKLHSADVAVTNARAATQIHGGYGFMNEYPVARMWRDAKILEIGEGTNEVQRMLIARDLGLPT
jgi:short-chain 2-methylacyl-CoA dehydrogenase